MTTRIGPRMQQAVDYVRLHQGCPILPVARHVGPHGSLKIGYRTVHRAIRAGLIKASRVGARYSLTVES
jgi:hypothetical protein